MLENEEIYTNIKSIQVCTLHWKYILVLILEGIIILMIYLLLILVL